INEGKYTRKELVEQTAANFPDASLSAISTILSDGTSERYCRFPVLIYTDKADGGIVKFTDVPCARGSKITKETVVHAAGSKSKKEDKEVKKNKPAKSKEVVEDKKTTPAKTEKKLGGKKPGKKK
ncbi:MAG: hypothetical protein WC875_06020, partial [Candidatus Absconditabacterales bacterium]